MDPDIRWIEAVFGPRRPVRAKLNHICVPEIGRSALLEMAEELVGTDGLVAFYMPEGTEEIYQPGSERGRVICAVQLIPMPPGKRVEDYSCKDWDGSVRWPIGWPARAVHVCPEGKCPSLREHVESLFGSGSFGGYTARFQRGPFRLESPMRQRLNSDVSEFTRLV
jgi:hypothetical protein